MNTNIKNFHVLKAIYIGQSNTNRSRIKISSERFKQSIKIPFETDHGNDTCEIAEHWLKVQGFNLTGHAEGQNCYYIISDTFKPLRGK
jgi:hypothetical protein